MSFIVEGLSIPKEGQLLSINIYPDGKVTYNLDLECKQIAVAKTVPTPHGRLVDFSIIGLPTVIEAEE